MISQITAPSRDDVLDAFAVEPNPARDTLESYLRSYPQYAVELIDLSRELSRVIVADKDPLSNHDQALIEAAWKEYSKAAPTIGDPFEALPVAKLREIAELLEVPRQILSAFREKRIVITSVPRTFLAHLAAALDIKVEDFADVLATTSESNPARAYKADTKPGTDTLITFEQLLIDAGVPDEKRARLVAEDD